MSVKLTYKTSRIVRDEIQKESEITETVSLEIPEDVTEIDLVDKGIKEIDLAPLTHCTTLKEIGFIGNKMENIDLTPLGTCTNLQKLSIGLNNLHSIDLTPLSACVHLEWLDVGHNQLKNIGLSALSSCVSLKSLTLGGNLLESIDLTPLAACKELQTIELFSNDLQSIELLPLSSCSNLKKLVLGENQLESLNLVPLISCVNLEYLDFEYNPIPYQSSVDVTPLHRNSKMVPFKTFKYAEGVSSWIQPISKKMASHATYNHPTHLYPWSFLFDIIEERKHDQYSEKHGYGVSFVTQYDICCALGLADYGFVDCNLTEVFLTIPPDTSTEKVRKIVGDFLVDEIVATVERGGPTIGLELEKIITIDGAQRISKLTQQITEQRKREIEYLTFYQDEGHYDTSGKYNYNELEIYMYVSLSELWLTAYGYQVLTALDVKRINLGAWYDGEVRESCRDFESPLITTVSGFESIKHTFAEFGLELKVEGHKIGSSTTMSDDLRKAILWIIENRGKPWSKIMDL